MKCLHLQRHLRGHLQQPRQCLKALQHRRLRVVQQPLLWPGCWLALLKRCCWCCCWHWHQRLRWQHWALRHGQTQQGWLLWREAMQQRCMLLLLALPCCSPAWMLRTWKAAVQKQRCWLPLPPGSQMPWRRRGQQRCCWLHCCCLLLPVRLQGRPAPGAACQPCPPAASLQQAQRQTVHLRCCCPQRMPLQVQRRQLAWQRWPAPSHACRLQWLPPQARQWSQAL